MENSKFKTVRRVLWLILFANFGVAVAKVIFGIIIKSASMTADGFHSITDGSSNIVGLIGISMASKPIDQDHNYGHKKFETITGLFIVAMLVFLGIKIIAGGMSRLIHPLTPQISISSLVVMVIKLAINLFITTYERKKGEECNSTILISDAMHTKSDIYVTIGVLITLVAMKLGAPVWVDSLASMIVAGFILKAAYEIFDMACGILVDRAVVDNKEIEKIAVKHELVKGVHKIRNRGTMDDLHIDMHILASCQLTLEQTHKLSHDIEKMLQEELNPNAQVITHIEPYETELGKED
ncbi:MAG: cation transporter [Cellulosilyticum sp.]|nr:cation transporter [Cellulosilyticum sp.]